MDAVPYAIFNFNYIEFKLKIIVPHSSKKEKIMFSFVLKHSTA